jgi:hypothetical protein
VHAFSPSKTNGQVKETGSSKAAATVQLSAAAERAGARGGTFMQPKNRQRNAPFEVKNECTVRTSLGLCSVPQKKNTMRKKDFPSHQTCDTCMEY